MHPITINLPDNTFRAAEQLAQARGYLNVQEYLVDWLESETECETPMTPALRAALEEGEADVAGGRVVSWEQAHADHLAFREAWMKSNAN